MAKFFKTMGFGSLFFLSRRSASTVGAERVVGHSLDMMRKVVGNSGQEAAAGIKGKEVFWMRDPKTGNWMPENGIGGDESVVDAAELRAKLLPANNGRIHHRYDDHM